MEIQKISFGQFRAAEHVQFGTEICELIDEAPGKEQLPQYETYKRLHGEEQKIFKKTAAAALTPELVQADRMRDKHTTGFFLAIESAQHHYLPEQEKAADRLAGLLKPYKGVVKYTYNAQTASLTRMAAELQKTAAAADIDLLGLAGWVIQIDTDNNNFARLMMLRSTDNLDKEEGTMTEIRSRVDAAYFDMVKHINALIVVNGQDAYTEPVKLINERIDYYKRTVAERQTASANKKAKK